MLKRVVCVPKVSEELLTAFCTEVEYTAGLFLRNSFVPSTDVTWVGSVHND